MSLKKSFRESFGFVRESRRNGTGGPFRDRMDITAHDCLLEREWKYPWDYSLSGNSIGYVAKSKRAGRLGLNNRALRVLPLP
jgi:hypothetical protein